MKTPEEIKNALKQCDDIEGSCCGCSFDTLDRCEKNAVVLEYIEQLEERIAIMEEGQKNGRWEESTNYMIEKCSKCGYGKFGDRQMNFCPNCGAKMDMHEADAAEGGNENE